MKKSKPKKAKKLPGKPAKNPPAGNPGEKPPEGKNLGGRPSVMNREVEDEICARIAEGESLVKILRSDPKFPNYSTVTRHLRATEGQDDGFCTRYAHAREDQADFMADEILEIADDGRNDTYFDDEGNERTDHDVVQRSKLRVEARKWIASKLKPKKYSDRLALTDPDGKGLMPNSIEVQLVERLKKLSPEQRKKRIEELRSKNARSKTR